VTADHGHRDRGGHGGAGAGGEGDPLWMLGRQGGAWP